MKRDRGASLRRLALGGGLALLVVACLPTGASLELRSWLVLGGFLVLTIVLARARARPPGAPALVAAFFAVFGGLSAVIAANEPGPRLGGSASFTYAAVATCLGGVAALAAVLLTGRWAGERLPGRQEPTASRLVRVGVILVAIGLAGLGAAVTRFVLTELPSDDLWAAAKSFWVGNTWMLLVANSAVVGFGLWVAGLVVRGARAVEYVVPGALAIVFLAALVPTGQRGFGIELVLVVIAIGVARLRNRRTVALALVVALVPLAVVTQAARNEASETGTVRLGSVVDRLDPDRWGTLFGSQLASFRWTWDVAARRYDIGAPNSFVQLALKPVPRGVLPDKSQGFGEEFTRALYPDAAADEIAFATPLVAESDYNGGLLGVTLVLALFGALAAFGELFVVRGAPASIRPVWAIVLIFDGFMILRGDLANALVFGASLTAPLAGASLALRYRPLPRRRRIVLDALQVPRELSGIGAQVLRFVDELVAASVDRLEIRAASETFETVRDRLPAEATHRLPLRRSRPRMLRIAYQQVLAPLLDARSTTLICPGDQAPAWGRARVVLVIYDVRRLVDEEAPRLERLFYRRIVPRGARRASTILTASEFSRREIVRLVGVPPDKIRVIAHSVRVRASAPTLRERGPLLVVGAVRTYKGLDTVIAALERLQETHRPTVIVAGSIDDPPGLRRQVARRGLERWVRLEGWVENERLEALYAEAIAAICPSRYEGYGLAVAESIARGLPTVASDIPSHREIAGDAALFFPAGDDVALSDCMLRVLTPDVRRQLAESAFRRALEIDASRPPAGALVSDLVGTT